MGNLEPGELKSLIASARERVEEPPSETVNVVVGAEGKGKFVAVTVSKITPAEWLRLESLHPPRVGVPGDERLGSDVYSIPPDYPVDRIKVDGDPVDVDTWRDLWDVIDVIHKENVTGLMYGLNRLASMMQVEALGKASAGGRKQKRA